MNPFIIQSFNYFVNLSFGYAYESPYKFNGKEKDEETGYNNYEARYYGSDIGIFLSVDPMADEFPGWTPYHYCYSNPIKYVDPDGQQAVTVARSVRYASNTSKLKRTYRAIKIFIFGTTLGVGGTEVYNHYLEGDRSEEVLNSLIERANLNTPTTSESYDNQNNNDNNNQQKKTNPKKEAREKAKEKRDNQPAPEKYAKDKAKAKEKAEGPDARRKAHDAKEKGSPDRTKKQIDEDYKIK